MSNTDTTVDDNPDTYLIESSVPDVRAFEKKTRGDIETQKKELRAMVGEQYLDLISAADAIITMSKNAQVIQSNLSRMQEASGMDNIKLKTKSALQQHEKESSTTQVDNKRRKLYVVAALIKSLADVPEQIWHALENHRYLHASRLFTLAKVVHDKLEDESNQSVIDIEMAFPVVQRQWDAVSVFGPQIIQRSTHYLRISEQSPEHIAELMVGLMLLDNMSYKDTLEKMLEMRTNVIHEIIQHNAKASETQIQRTTHQLREIILIIKRTITQAYDVFYSKDQNHKQTLIESFVENFQKTFLIPSKLSHGNETPSQPAITRVFSPSSNVHLIVRYLPEIIQNSTPDFDPVPVLKPEQVEKMVQNWLGSINDALQLHLPNIFKPLDTESGLIKVRSRVWELLDEDENTKDIKNNKWQAATQSLVGTRYSLWDAMLRDAFNNHAKEIISKNFEALSVQPNTVVWPLVTDKNQKCTKKDFSVTVHVWPGMSTANSILPSLSSSQEIENFKKSLRETSYDRTDLLYKLQESFDSVLSASRKDMQAHFSSHENDYFHAVDDTNMIKNYFQDACYQAVLKYADELKLLFAKIDSWSDKQAVNDLSIFLGRLAKNIALLSKELPKALLLTDESTPVFELKSGVNKDPRLNEIQNKLTDTYHEAHKTWINEMSNQFGKNLRNVLLTSQWNDQCSSVLVWENVEDDIKLPIQATNEIVRVIFTICKEIQRVNSSILDQSILEDIRKQLFKTTIDAFNTLLDTKDIELTENGALQMIFDYMFLSHVLQQKDNLSSNNKMLSRMQEQIDAVNWDTYEPHFKPCVEKFYLKQTLLFGVLTGANGDTYEKARKIMSSQQQGQYNVIPVAAQPTRFNLLPIGHLISSSIKTR